MEGNENSIIEVFFSYAHEDEDLKDRLEKHLGVLRRLGNIKSWNDRKIQPGEVWERFIDNHINSAHIILLLISADFINSDYCYGAEMAIALKRHEAGETIAIPIILRPCDWELAPFAKLQALPKDGKPIITWTIQDEAFTDVAKGIRKVVEELISRMQKLDATIPASPNMAKVFSPQHTLSIIEAAFVLGSPVFRVNGQELVIDVAPYIKNGYTYMPARYVAKALGVSDENIVWNLATKKLTLIKGNTIMQFTIGSNILMVNGMSIIMDVAPEVTNENIMIPPRYIAQVLGATVTWDEVTQTISFILLHDKDS